MPVNFCAYVEIKGIGEVYPKFEISDDIFITAPVWLHMLLIYCSNLADLSTAVSVQSAIRSLSNLDSKKNPIDKCELLPIHMQSVV